MYQVPHSAALRLEVLDVICDTYNSNRLRNGYRFQVSFEMRGTGGEGASEFCDLDIRRLDTSGELDAICMSHVSTLVEPVLPGPSTAQDNHVELELEGFETMARYLLAEFLPLYSRNLTITYEFSENKLNSAKKRNLLSRMGSSLLQTLGMSGTNSRKRRRSIDTTVSNTSLLPVYLDLNYSHQSSPSHPTSAHTIPSMTSTQLQRPCCNDGANSVPQIVVSSSDAPQCHTAIVGLQGDQHPKSRDCQTCTLPNNSLVLSLCSSLQATMANTTKQSCIGILPSTLGDRFRVCPGIRKTSPANLVPLMSLRELIMRHSKSAGQLPPSPLLRLKLAVLLSSSVMQLHGTGWLNDLWSSGDIYFEAASNMQLKGSLLAQPRVQKVFHIHSSSNNNNAEPKGPMANINDNWASGIFHFGNSVVFSLGIVLIELHHWKPWEVLQGSRTKGDALIELVKELNEWAGEGYQTAVQRCIQGLGLMRPKLEEEDFKRKVYEEIVTVLEKELKTFTNEEDVRKLFEATR